MPRDAQAVRRFSMAVVRGGPGSPFHVTAQSIALARFEVGVRRGDAHAVHQFRVTTRRLLAALSVLLPASAECAGATVRLDALATTIGGVRDLDVLDAAVRDAAQRRGKRLRTGWSPLRAAIAGERAAALAELVAALDGPAYRQLRMQLRSLGSVPVRDPDTVAQRLEALVREFRRAGEKARRSPKPKRLHRVRRRGKQLRYALDASGAGAEPAGAPMLQRLSHLQNVLGRAQDACAQIEWVEARAAQLPPAAAFAAGVFAADLARDLRRARRDFAPHWRRLDRGGRWRAVQREARRAGSQR